MDNSAAVDTHFAYDMLGNLTQTTDAAGNRISLQYDALYRPFGDVLSSSSAENEIRSYTSEKRDATQLTYLNARYYDSALGRFISADSVVPSIGAAGLNRCR